VVVETALGVPASHKKLLGAPGKTEPAEGPHLGLGVGLATYVGATNVCALGIKAVIDPVAKQAESQFIALSVC
jgi:hypothetical protein